MKKVISFVLAALMLVSAVPTALATNDYTAGTRVEYTANGNESYTITVPALLAPGGSGTVTLSGTWADNRIITVTADPTVTLKNSIKETDTKTLNVNFDGISEAGSNTGSQTFTESVSVDNITNALFGTWSGKFNYNVECVNKEPVGGAVFSKYFANPGCHEKGHDEECWIVETKSLSWDELKLAENGAKYDYDASAITDTEVGDYAFVSSKNIVSIDIPEGIAVIGNNAFASSSIKNVTLPVSVQTIKSHAFIKTGLESITYKGTIAQWKALVEGDETVPNVQLFCSDGTIFYRAKIEFTIDGTEYQAENGMTWGEWCDSEYNTLGCNVNSEGTLIEIGFDFIWVAGDHVVSPDEVISESHDYVIDSLL